MSLQRSLSWTSALRELRGDRVQISPEARRVFLRNSGFANLAADCARASARTRPLVVAGAYDRRAIMTTAVAAAQARREVTGEA